MTSIKKIKICLLLSTLLFSIVIAPMANAYDINSLVSPTGRAWEWGLALYAVADEQGGVASSTNYISGTAIFLDIPAGRNAAYNNWILKGITKDTQIDFKKGHYYKTTLAFNITGSDRYGVQLPQLNRLVVPSGAPYKLVSVEANSIQCYELGWTEGKELSSGSPNMFQFQNWNGCRRGYVAYDVIVQALQDRTAAFQLGDNAQWMFESLVIKDTSQPSHSIRFGTLTPLAITEYAPDSMSTINDQQQQAGEQAQTDGQSGATSSEQSTQQGTQSLISALTGFVGAITNITPSNCTITGDMGALDMGTLNFCQDNPPAIITTISSLILIGITIPIVIWTVKKIISMFRSFTNG